MIRLTSTKGRVTATALATGALALGSVGGAVAATHSPAGGSTGTTTHSFSAAGLGSFAPTGIFKALFGVFGAVRTQAPVVAAPIISQAVTAQTITQAEADQLTAMFSGTFTMPTGHTGHAGFTPPSAGEMTVLHQIIGAIITQLPTIAQPVLDADVTAGDITQSQADLIEKVLTKFASLASSAGLVSSSAATPAASGDPLRTLESKLASKVKKASKKHSKHAKHARHAKTAR